jgi:hypothetical protein
LELYKVEAVANLSDTTIAVHTVRLRCDRPEGNFFEKLSIGLVTFLCEVLATEMKNRIFA